MRLSQNHNQLAIYTHVYIDDFRMTTTGFERVQREEKILIEFVGMNTLFT